MKTLTLTVPDSLDVDSREIAMIVSTKLYEQGKLSLGQAAEVAGLSKRTFAEVMGRYGVSIFNFPPEELASEVQNFGAARPNEPPDPMEKILMP
jgi:predicted HTH domain antitoxin